MFSKLATDFVRIGSNRICFFARRSFTNMKHYGDSYNLIEKFKTRNPMFWNELNSAVKQVEQAERNNTPLTNLDLEAIKDLKYSLSRTYDHPALFEQLEPIYSVLNKADELVKPTHTPKF